MRPSRTTLQHRADVARAEDARRNPPPAPDWPVGCTGIVTDGMGQKWNAITTSVPWKRDGYDVVTVAGMEHPYLCSRFNIGPHDPHLQWWPGVPDSPGDAG